MNFTETNIGILAGFPPEHNAHVIEAVGYVRALQSMQFRDVLGLTCSESRGQTEMLTENLDVYSAKTIIDPMQYPQIPILNMHEFVDGYSIQPAGLEDMIAKHRIDIFFLTYYPLFGQKLIELLKKMHKKVMLITKMPLVRPGQDSIFANYHKGYAESLSAVDTILAYQENDVDLVEQHYSVSRGKTHAAHKFVDEELVTAARQRQHHILEEYDLAEFFSDAEYVIGLISRIDPEKNVLPFTQEIWPRIVARLPNAKLFIAGTGTQSEDLQTMTSNSPNVYFLGKSLPCIDILALLAHVNVLAAPSGTDYTPRIPMEALLMGSQVVANDLNFNDIYRPYARLVPVNKFLKYNPYGYNDNARALQNFENLKFYGVPDPSIFADSILEALTSSPTMPLPEGMFTSDKFCNQFLQALKSSS